jgi:hypothetical protein
MTVPSGRIVTLIGLLPGASDQIKMMSHPTIVQPKNRLAMKVARPRPSCIALRVGKKYNTVIKPIISQKPCSPEDDEVLPSAALWIGGASVITSDRPEALRTGSSWVQQ